MSKANGRAKSVLIERNVLELVSRLLGGQDVEDWPWSRALPPLVEEDSHDIDWTVEEDSEDIDWKEMLSDIDLPPLVEERTSSDLPPLVEASRSIPVPPPTEELESSDVLSEAGRCHLPWYRNPTFWAKAMKNAGPVSKEEDHFVEETITARATLWNTSRVWKCDFPPLVADCDLPPLVEEVESDKLQLSDGRFHFSWRHHQTSDDCLKYRPNPDLLVSKLDQDSKASGGVYRPPMIAPVAMEEDIRPKDKLQEVVEREGERSSKLAGKDSKITAVEEVKKDINALSMEEKMGVVMSDAPELVGLLLELREGLDELRNKVQPLVEKAERRSVRGDPVIARLVELRLLMEKIRPIDKKLQYQIDKLLKTANTPAAESREQKEDALKYRPNPDLLVSKLDQDSEATGGVYRPPMIVPVAMEDDIRPKDKRNKERAEKESRRSASRRAYMKEIANELEGKPEEMEKNRGLTPHRKKLNKNPRKKYKLEHDKAVIRRKRASADS